MATLQPDLESHRMQAVRRYDILDSPPDGSFDHVTQIAARMFGTPIAIISIVDTDRIWFKSHHGVDIQEITRDLGLCASAIMQKEPWIISNAKMDPRTISNPLVAGKFGLQFYLGIPLETHDGFNLGTLCVLDFEPKTVDDAQIANLKELARVVMDQMELRLAARKSISELSNALEQKEAALNQSKLMALEIEHRVHNSLGLIISMLEVQSLQLQGTEAAQQIAKAAGKIMAIAEVHKHMQLTETVVKADCAQYLERLCSGLSTIVGLTGSGSISLKADPLSVTSDQIVRIGLIVNELVTNAVKNGATVLEASLTRIDATNYCLSVSDNGNGLPANFFPDKMSGLGMKVVNSLVRNMHGQLTYGHGIGDVGTQFQIKFPVDPD